MKERRAKDKWSGVEGRKPEGRFSFKRYPRLYGAAGFWIGVLVAWVVLWLLS